MNNNEHFRGMDSSSIHERIPRTILEDELGRVALETQPQEQKEEVDTQQTGYDQPPEDPFERGTLEYVAENAGDLISEIRSEITQLGAHASAEEAAGVYKKAEGLIRALEAYNPYLTNYDSIGVNEHGEELYLDEMYAYDIPENTPEDIEMRRQYDKLKQMKYLLENEDMEMLFVTFAKEQERNLY